MSNLIRFGVSIEADLLGQFDELISRRGYSNRSEAIRDLIRAALVEEEWQRGTYRTVGAVCIVYDHHVGDITHRLLHVQHKYPDKIVSTLHVHLDEHNCFEIIVLRGRARDIKTIADHLISLRGVKHGQLVMGTTGQRLA